MNNELARLKRQEKIAMRDCERARHRSMYWAGRQRIAMNDFFASMYSEKSQRADREAKRLHEKAQKIIRKIAKLMHQSEED